MDEAKTLEQNNIPVEVPQASPNSPKPAGSHRNLILAILVLVVGAIIISAVFIFGLPNNQEESSVTTTTTEVTNIDKTTDLDTAAKELDSTNLDDYQAQLKQNDSDASQF